MVYFCEICERLLESVAYSLLLDSSNSTLAPLQDVDGNGLIDVQEMRLVLKDLGLNMSDEAIVVLQQKLDVNGDGVVQISELKQCWNGETPFCFVLF